MKQKARGRDDEKLRCKLDGCRGRERERESHVYTIGEKKSPLIIVLFFLIVVALLFTIGNENETTKNQ